MKKIQAYEAEDGTVFSNVQEALDYERLGEFKYEGNAVIFYTTKDSVTKDQVGRWILSNKKEVADLIGATIHGYAEAEDNTSGEVITNCPSESLPRPPSNWGK